MRQLAFITGLLAVLNFSYAQDTINPFNIYCPDCPITLEDGIQFVIGYLPPSSSIEKDPMSVLLDYWTYDEIQTTLIQQIQEKSGARRSARIKLLGATYDPSLITFFAPYLYDSSEWVVLETVAVLQKHAYQEAAIYIGEKLLNQKTLNIATFQMIDALERISTNEALQYLKQIKPKYEHLENYSNQIEGAIARLSDYNSVLSKRKYLKRLLRSPDDHKDFYWAVNKMYKKSTPKISLRFVKTLFDEIKNKEAIINRLMILDFGRVLSKEQIYLDSRYRRLLRLRKHLGDTLSDRELLLLDTLKKRQKRLFCS